MAPASKTKAKKGDAAAPAPSHAPTHAHDVPSSKKESDTVPASSDGFVFGVNLDDPRDIEDDSSVLAPIAKYAILGMICLMSFAIRLFAVVRYESVRFYTYY